MTRDEDLNITVTPEVEDAFFAFRVVMLPNDNDTEESFAIAENARKRVEALPNEGRIKAINTAFKMFENIEKYGIPCADWK